MTKMKWWREIAERVIVFLLLLMSSGFALWTAKTGSAGLPARDKQEAQSFISIFWFVGTMLLMGAVGVFINLLFRPRRPPRNGDEK